MPSLEIEDIKNAENIKKPKNSAILKCGNISSDIILSDEISELFHDLKNPLIAQIRTLELVLEGRFGKIENSAKEMIEMVLESELYMKNLIYKTLENFKTNYKKSNKTCFDFEEMVKSIYFEMKTLFDEKNIKIVLFSSLQEDKKQVYLDFFEIKRVVYNFMINAYSCAFSNSRVLINMFNKENVLRFELETESPKIPDDIKEKLFKGYIDRSNIKENTKKSTGLGLYICKKIIDKYKGSIGLITDEDRKTNKFFFEIPLK